jgi:DNA-directed RNA polymerase subunit RPC12/RpoP
MDIDNMVEIIKCPSCNSTTFEKAENEGPTFRFGSIHRSYIILRCTYCGDLKYADKSLTGQHSLDPHLWIRPTSNYGI